MTISDAEAIRIGEEGERLFREYADANGIPYLWIDQHRETTPAWLRRYGAGESKRPDAIMPGESDVILVDAKHRKIYRQDGAEFFTLGKREAELLGETQRRLGKRVVLAYKDNQNPDADWYAVLLDDLLRDSTRIEEGPNGPYYAIPVQEFALFDEHSAVGRKQERLF